MEKVWKRVKKFILEDFKREVEEVWEKFKCGEFEEEGFEVLKVFREINEEIKRFMGVEG